MSRSSGTRPRPPSLRSEEFEREGWKEFRSALLDVLSWGGEITDRTWELAEEKWLSAVTPLLEWMPLSQACDVAVTDGLWNLLFGFEIRNWTFDDTTGRWRPPN